MAGQLIGPIAAGLVAVALALAILPDPPPDPIASPGFPEALAEALSIPSIREERVEITDYQTFCLVPSPLNASRFLADFGFEAPAGIFVENGKYLVALIADGRLAGYRTFPYGDAAEILEDRFYTCHLARVRTLVLTPMPGTDGQRAIRVERREDGAVRPLGLNRAPPAG